MTSTKERVLACSVSFNLTPWGRDTLAQKAYDEGISQGRLLNRLIWKHGKVFSLPQEQFTCSPIGGRKSYYFGKTRGTTTCCEIDPETKEKLKYLVEVSNMSRGDYIDHLLRVVYS